MTPTRWLTVKAHDMLLLNGVGLWHLERQAEFAAVEEAAEQYTGATWLQLYEAGWRVVPVVVSEV